jgi:hypothetical protein
MSMQKGCEMKLFDCNVVASTLQVGCANSFYSVAFLEKRKTFIPGISAPLCAHVPLIIDQPLPRVGPTACAVIPKQVASAPQVPSDFATISCTHVSPLLPAGKCLHFRFGQKRAFLSKSCQARRRRQEHYKNFFHVDPRCGFLHLRPAHEHGQLLQTRLLKKPSAAAKYLRRFPLRGCDWV